MYTVDYYINKFESIPEEKWITGRVDDGEGRHCAMGHCSARLIFLGNGEFHTNEEAYTLSTLFSNYLKKSIMGINDDYVREYSQPTPKQRVLAALRDIKDLQEQEKAVIFAQQVVNTAKEEVFI